MSVHYLGIESPLELQHVGILLWVDVVVGEDDWQTIYCESVCVCVCVGGGGVHGGQCSTHTVAILTS